MIFKKINFKLISIILLFFCTQQVKCKHVSKRSIMQDLMSNFMQILDPKSNLKQMPYQIIKSETVDGKVQKYTVPNVDDEKMKDVNNAIKLLSIQSMLNRHYKNQYRKHKMMKEVEHLSKGNENNEQFKKLNEHTLKKYQYIDSYNNHRFNKEMAKLQKQAQKLIEISPHMFKETQDQQFLGQNPQQQLNALPDFYTNSHGLEQNPRFQLKNKPSANVQPTSQVFLLNPNEITANSQKYTTSEQTLSPTHFKYFSRGKLNDPSEQMTYYSLPVSKEPFSKVPSSHPDVSHLLNTKELSYSRPYRGPKDIPWSMKQKSPEVFLPYQQEIPWSVVPLPPPLPTLNMVASNHEYTWALGGSTRPMKEDNLATISNKNSYWALKPLPPPMQTQFSSRDMRTSGSQVSKDCHNIEDVTLESTSDPYVLNTYAKNSPLKTDISHENYDDLHVTQESTKTYIIDIRNNNDSKRKDKEDSQQKESTVQQYSINPILAQQYQRYNNQQKNMVKVNNNTNNANDNSKQKENSNSKYNKKQEQVQSATNQREHNITIPTTYTRKYTPKNQKQLINPELTQNFNVNQEKVLQQRQQQLKQFYEKQKQQRQQIRNNNKNVMADTKNTQDNGGRSYVFNSQLNTQQVATIPIDIAIPVEESDWIPIQPKYKISNMNSVMEYENVPLASSNNILKAPSENPVSNVDVMMVFKNETKVKGPKDSPKSNKNEELKTTSQNQTIHLETCRHISNDQIENVDESIRQMTFNKPIYDVPIVNDKNSIASEKTVLIEVVNADLLKRKTNISSIEDIEGSESNILPVKVRYDNQIKLDMNIENNENKTVQTQSPVRHYQRVKVKSKHKKYANVENVNQNQSSNLNNTNSTDTISSDIKTSALSVLQRSKDDLDISNHGLVKDAYFPVSTEKTIVVQHDHDKTSPNKSSEIKVNQIEDIPISLHRSEQVKDSSSNLGTVQESLSLVRDNKDYFIPKITSKDDYNNSLLQNNIGVTPNYEHFDVLEEYEASSTNIKELIANRSKIIRPFFRNKQNQNFSTSSTTTIPTTTTTMKPIIVQHVEKYASKPMKDQNFEESKTQNHYDEYDEQISFENIKAAQAFNFPKTDVSYSINIPKSSQSVYKSVSNERVVNANRKQTGNNYRDEVRHRNIPKKHKDQNDYENREEQTYVTPTYDRNEGQYSVYENTNPYEGGGQTFYNDDDISNNDGVNMNNIKIPSPDEIDLDSIDIPNPETIGVRGVGGSDDDSDREKDETEDDDDSNNDKDSENDGDIEEENGEDADNEESKHQKQIDTSLNKRNNQEQNNMDLEKTHSNKQFEISSIPIPAFNKEKMNHINEKYNIPRLNIEEQEKNHDADSVLIPNDYLVKNQYNEEIPNYKVPLEFSQEKHGNEEEMTDERLHSLQNNFDDGIPSLYNPNINAYNFPYISSAEKFRMRNLLKQPQPDQFDQDENFGYAKFSDEYQIDNDFNDLVNKADEKKDPQLHQNRPLTLKEFITPTQDISSFRSMQPNYPSKVIESHIVKQIPMAFKTVIKPVNYGSIPFSPLAQKFQKPNNGIRQPFRPNVSKQNEARFAGQQISQDNRQQSQYLEHSKVQSQPTNQYGRNIQSEIVPALEYDPSQFQENFRETPQKQNQQQQSHNHAPQYSQTRFTIPQRNEQAGFSNNFYPTVKTRSQLDSTLSQIESSNYPSSKDIFSDPAKAKSISNVNMYRHSSLGQPIPSTTGSHGDKSLYQQNYSTSQMGNVGTFNSDYFNTNNLNVFQNQLEIPGSSRTNQPIKSDLKQGLVVYHPTKSQAKSISHVLITPPTVDRQAKYNTQPQIEEKNFQHTTARPPSSQQKRMKVQHARVNHQTSTTPGLAQSADGRIRYIKDHNNNYKQTNTLQQIKKHNSGPQYNHLRKPSTSHSSNNFRNIPVGDHYKNNFRPHLSSPSPTYTLQQIQNIKSSNLPPHIREHSEVIKPKYELPALKNIQQPIQGPYSPTTQQLNYYKNAQNTPTAQNEQYVNQLLQSQQPMHGLKNTGNNNFGTQNFGGYIDNIETEIPDNDEPNDSEEDINNSEEGEDNDERVRPKEPVHHDTDSKEHYLYNNGQQYIEQKYQVPNNNEFVQNIKLLKKIPKIEKLRVTNEFTNVNVNQYNKYHPENAQHFLPTPIPEMHVTARIKHKGKGKSLIFTPSQQDPIANNMEIDTSGYNLQEHINNHNLQSLLVAPSHFSHGIPPSTLPQNHFSQNLQSSPINSPQFSQNIQSSTLPPHFSTTPSSISEHPVPLLSPQQYLPPTTPLTPYYTTARPEEQSQFIPPEREHFLQIQTPIPSTYGHLPQHLQGHGQGQPQFNVHEEPRPQFYINQQYSYEVPQQNQNFNNAPLHQPIIENYSPPQTYVQHQVPRPHQRLPLGLPPNPDIQHFDPHNPHPAPLQIHQQHGNYPPNLEQYQLPEHPPLEEQQFFPLQNMNSPGRMIHTIYPYKKSDENHSNERDEYYYKGNDGVSVESRENNEYKDNKNEYSSNINVKYKDDLPEINTKIGSTEESAEHSSTQNESKNSRTDSKLQFDYVDSKTRIQPHRIKIVGENLKLQEFLHDSKETQEMNNPHENETSKNIKNEASVQQPDEVSDVVQEYVDAFNKQESKQNEQVREPDFVIQKSLQTEYSLFSNEEENIHEENRFVPINYVTPTPIDTKSTAGPNSNTTVPNGNIQTFKLPENKYESVFNNNRENLYGFQLNFNRQALQNPQVQHHHFIQHIISNHGTDTLQNNGNIAPINQKHSHSQKNPIHSNRLRTGGDNSQHFNDVPVLIHNNPAPGILPRNPLQFKINAPVDISNNNPSHYFLKDTDMPRAIFNIATTAISENKPNIKTYAQYGQTDSKIHQSIVNHDTNIVKPQDIPLVLNPLLIKTQSQTLLNPSQNKKIKIIIPTLTEQRAPIQQVHYKIPNGEVIINRYHGNVKPTLKPNDAASGTHLQLPQPFQYKNVITQVLPFNNNLPVIHQNVHSLHSTTQPPSVHHLNSFGNVNLVQKQPLIISPSHQPIAKDLFNQNVQQFQKNEQNIIEQQQILNNLQLNQNIQSLKVNQNYQPSQIYQKQQATKNIPINHQHYDIFGEYGQKKQYQEPYVYEFPNGNENNEQPVINSNHYNSYLANNRYSPQNMQVFQPLVLDFDNPISNFYYKNKNNGAQPVKPKFSEPVELPSNLVRGVESEAIITKKVTHPSVHDLSFEQSEHSTSVINITGTSLINPHAKNETKKSADRRRTNNTKMELTPMMTYLTISQNRAQNPYERSEKKTNASLKRNNIKDDHMTSLSGEMMLITETSSAKPSHMLHFENNEHNIPILSSIEKKIASEKHEGNENLSNKQKLKVADKKYDYHNLSKNLEDKMKLELGNKQKPEESYEKMEILYDNVGTFSNNYEILDVLPNQSSTEIVHQNTKTGDAKTQRKNYERYVDSLNKSYDIIRDTMKKEDEKDKIDISGLYNTDLNNQTNKRTSKKLFNKYVNIARESPKSPEKITSITHNENFSKHQQQRPNIFGKTIDINYFNRRKNGIFSNENAFDDDTTNNITDGKSNTDYNNKYSMRIINLLKGNVHETPNEIDSTMETNREKN